MTHSIATSYSSTLVRIIAGALAATSAVLLIGLICALIEAVPAPDDDEAPTPVIGHASCRAIA